MNADRVLQLRLVLFLLFTALLAGCGDRTEKEQTAPRAQSPEMKVARGGIYRVPLLNDPASLDPAYVMDEYGTAP